MMQTGRFPRVLDNRSTCLSGQVWQRGVLCSLLIVILAGGARAGRLFGEPLHLDPATAGTFHAHGAATTARDHATPESPWMVELCNCGEGPWGTVSFTFNESLDLSRVPIFKLRMRGAQGGERLIVNIVDRRWHPSAVSHTSSDPLPSEGLRTSWQNLTVDLRTLKPAIDLTQVQGISFEIGTATAGNPAGARLTIADLMFMTSKLGTAKSPRVSASPLIPSAAPEHRLPGRWSGRRVIPLSDGGPWVRRVTRPGSAAVCGLLLAGMILWVPALRRRLHGAFPHQPSSRPMAPIYELNVRTWGAVRDSHGQIQLGQFRAITTRDLRTLARKGFHAVWLMGIWKVGDRAKDIAKRYADDFVGSPFAITDYVLDPELGAEEEFRALVTRAHRERLKVFVDFVPNHTSLDSRLLAEHPEFFIHRVLQGEEASLSDEELLRRHPHYYFVYEAPSYPERGTRVQKRILVAHGNDPHFYPWGDTAQLDYAHPELRRQMIDTLLRIARLADGVRCDMAMLVLREQVKRHRHPEISWEEFNRLMPREFWKEAIPAVKAVAPQFVFIAESYWNLEGYLQQLGFDLTYNKQLYDHLRAVIWGGEPEGLVQFLEEVGQPFLERSLHFLENHDEERAITTFGDGGQRAAAVLISTIPGALLVHQGQLEGWQERLPVQRVIPLTKEPTHPTLSAFYEQLLRLVNHPLFQRGSFHLLTGTNRRLFAAARRLGRVTALVVINLTDAVQRGSVRLPVEEWGIQPHRKYRLNDLFYPLKLTETRNRAGVSREYHVLGKELLQDGLYVELDGFDAHIFIVERGRADNYVNQWQRVKALLTTHVAAGETASDEHDGRQEVEA